MPLDFILFTLLSIVGLAGGMLWQHKDRSEERVAAASRHLHLFTIAGLWAPLIGISLWRDFPVNSSTAWMLLIEPLHMIVPALLSLWFARKWLKWDWGKSGVLAMAVSLSNKGVTLGAVLCLMFLPSERLQAQPELLEGIAEPSRQAMSIGLASVTIMSILAVVFLFPLAAWCRSHSSNEKIAIGGLFKESFLSLRAAILWFALVGIALNLAEIPPPDWLGHKAISLSIIMTSAITAYGGIGLRLHLSGTLSWPAQIWCNAAHLLMMPLLTLSVIWLAGTLGEPVHPLNAEAFLIVAATPAAIQAVAIPNLFHLDTHLAARLWAISTIVWLLAALPAVWLFTH